MSCSPQHEGLDLHFEGSIQTQKTPPIGDNFAPVMGASKPTSIIGQVHIWTFGKYVIYRSMKEYVHI